MTRHNYRPVLGIKDPLLGQSFHMYEPAWLTHLGASWTKAWFIYDEQPEYLVMFHQALLQLSRCWSK